MNKKFLFTTLVSDDLGLLTRSLPIARELRHRGHLVTFCNPAKAPSKLIADAGFDNIQTPWPLLSIMTGNVSLPKICRFLASRQVMRDVTFAAAFLKHLNRFGTPEIWNLDHFMYLLIPSEDYARAEVHRFMDLMSDYKPDAVVDFLNVNACMAARATHTPLITVVQADMHPQSKGFIWWREPPAGVPSPTQMINRILAELGLEAVDKTAELLVGDMTFVVGMPETDPLPETTNVTYLGPTLWDGPDEGLPEWITDLGTTEPLIWIYPGNPHYSPRSRTAFDSDAVTYACVEALRDKVANVVLSTGHQPLPKDSPSQSAVHTTATTAKPARGRAGWRRAAQAPGSRPQPDRRVRAARRPARSGPGPGAGQPAVRMVDREGVEPSQPHEGADQRGVPVRLM